MFSQATLLLQASLKIFHIHQQVSALAPKTMTGSQNVSALRSRTLKIFELWCMCRRVVPSPNLIVEYTDLKQRGWPRYAVRLVFLVLHTLEYPSTAVLQLRGSSGINQCSSRGRSKSEERRVIHYMNSICKKGSHNRVA
jgi:hypothetical protein